MTQETNASKQLARIGEADRLILQAMSDSLYPGAAPEMVYGVLNYCRAAKLDPMTKPVHIVNMGGRDVILPGINLYRVTAERTGNYLGQSEPEFGPAITGSLGGDDIVYPEWCKIVITKAVGEHTATFTAIEFWLENYGTKNKDSIEPNAMWRKRPYGQLSKCAEAQVLRKAFPDSVGAQPTFEEMSGKHLDPGEYIEAEVVTVTQTTKPNPLHEAMKKQATKSEGVAGESATSDDAPNLPPTNTGDSDAADSPKPTPSTDGVSIPTSGESATFEALAHDVNDATTKQHIRDVMKRAVADNSLSQEQRVWLSQRSNDVIQEIR